MCWLEALTSVMIGDRIKFICNLWEPCVGVLLGVKKPQLGADLAMNGCPRTGLLEKSLGSHAKDFLSVRMP